MTTLASPETAISRTHSDTPSLLITEGESCLLILGGYEDLIQLIEAAGRRIYRNMEEAHGIRYSPQPASECNRNQFANNEETAGSDC